MKTFFFSVPPKDVFLREHRSKYFGKNCTAANHVCTFSWPLPSLWTDYAKSNNWVGDDKGISWIIEKWFSNENIIMSELLLGVFWVHSCASRCKPNRICLSAWCLVSFYVFVIANRIADMRDNYQVQNL